MHAIRVKKYPIDLFTLKGPRYNHSVTIRFNYSNYKKFREL